MYFELCTPAALPMWSIRLEGEKRLVVRIVTVCNNKCDCEMTITRDDYDPSQTFLSIATEKRPLVNSGELTTESEFI